jgi:1-acyl-sn-glycerol-3-phosphate acyltransferase
MVSVQGIIGSVLMGYLVIVAQTCVASLLLAWIIARPLGEKAFLSAAVLIQDSWLTQIVFLLEFGVGVKLRLTGERPGAEAALVLPNHQTHDWVVMYSLAARMGTLGLVRTVIKKVISYIPGFGWGMYLCYWPFVSRSYDKDVKVLSKLFGAYKRCSLPVQLWLYAEGTRLTKKKLAESQAVAKEKGYPVWNHVLLPRHRGFTMAVDSLKGVVTMIHELTLSYEGWGNPPSLWQLLTTKRGKKHVMHVHIKRTPITDIPETEEGKKQWLMDSFDRKEKLLEYYTANNCFPGADLTPAFNPTTLIPHLIIWAIASAAMYYGIYRFFAWLF